jgi:hypothetical protein
MRRQEGEGLENPVEGDTGRQNIQYASKETVRHQWGMAADRSAGLGSALQVGAVVKLWT